MTNEKLREQIIEKYSMHTYLGLSVLPPEEAAKVIRNALATLPDIQRELLLLQQK